MTPQAAVVEFLRGERYVVARATVVTALQSLGSHSGGDWPRYTTDVWESAIDELIAGKTINVEPEGLRLAHQTSKPRPGLAPRQARKSKKVDTQQDMLF